jgi:hypothetical protein
MANTWKIHTFQPADFSQRYREMQLKGRNATILPNPGLGKLTGSLIFNIGNPKAHLTFKLGRLILP